VRDAPPAHDAFQLLSGQSQLLRALDLRDVDAGTDVAGEFAAGPNRGFRCRAPIGTCPVRPAGSRYSI